MDAEHDVKNIGIQIMISNDDTNGVVFATNSKVTKNIDIQIKKGKNTVNCFIDSFNLCSGMYWLGFAIDMPMVKFYYHEKALLSFNVSEIIAAPCSWSTLPVYGHVYLNHEWKHLN